MCTIGCTYERYRPISIECASDFGRIPKSAINFGKHHCIPCQMPEVSVKDIMMLSCALGSNFMMRPPPSPIIRFLFFFFFFFSFLILRVLLLIDDTWGEEGVSNSPDNLSYDVIHQNNDHRNKKPCDHHATRFPLIYRNGTSFILGNFSHFLTLCAT